MKKLFTTTILLACVTVSYAQKLTNVLDGFIISKFPTDRNVVGSKWVNNIGATTEGLPMEELIVSRSLNRFSLDKENLAGLEVALQNMLGLGGYLGTGLSVELNDMKVFTVRDLYKLGLVKEEMFVYEAVAASTFTLVYDKNVEAAIKAKLAEKNIGFVDVSASYKGKKLLTINGSNLFVALKILKVDKVESSISSKSFKGKMDLKNIGGYDISLNASELISFAVNKTAEELGPETYGRMSYLDNYILKYSKEKDITMSIMSIDKGNTGIGVYKKVHKFCYCKSFGDIDGRLFLINSMNTGKKVSFDYVLLDNFKLFYHRIPNMFKTNGTPMEIHEYGTAKGSKLKIISKTYHISNVI